jgi:hypothetical protein
MSQAVQEIIDRIQRLPEQDRRELEEYLAHRAEVDWQREAAEARRLANLRGIDQATINAAVDSIRNGS